MTDRRGPAFDYDFHGGGLDDVFDDYAVMHRTCPVSWSRHYGGFWTLSRHQDVMTAEHDLDTFSVAPSMILPSFGTDRPLMPLDVDPPALTAYRRILLPFFTPARMDELLPRTRELAEQLLDEVADAAAGPGQGLGHPQPGGVDVSAYCRLLPAKVFGEYCGFPTQDAAQFDRWVEDIVFARVDDEATARAAADDVYDYFRDLITLRRREPGPDVISALLAARYDDTRPLDDEEMLDICYLLFVAGLETTAGTIRAALWHLAQHPDDVATLVAEPAAIPLATEEFLRALSPVQAMARTLKRDIELGGVTLRAGERVVLALGAANRDPELVDAPHEIRLDRSSNRHVAFGVGAHRCLGSNLARREVNVALAAFLERFPRFELAEPAPWHGIGPLHLHLPTG
ncbi:MAG: cytochrome P450 [Actinomycetota bacterium]